MYQGGTIKAQNIVERLALFENALICSLATSNKQDSKLSKLLKSIKFQKDHIVVQEKILGNIAYL